MSRYYNKATGVEVRPSIHQITADCVILADDHPYWQPLPPGKCFIQDENGLPVMADEPGPSLEHRVAVERAWRDSEMAKVVAWLDQIRNDTDFDTVTYNGPYNSDQLNAYRVALCFYPEQEGFPDSERPDIDSF